MVNMAVKHWEIQTKVRTFSWEFPCLKYFLDVSNMNNSDQIPALESVNDGVNVDWEQQMELNRKS